MKNLFIIFLLIGFFVSKSDAKPANTRNSTDSVYRDDGDQRVPISVVVNSNTAVSPYLNISWTDDMLKDGNQQLRQHRVTQIINTNATYDLLIGTFSGFSKANDSWWLVPASSGSWTTFNHATFYMLMDVNAGTSTVRGYIEKEN